MSPRSATIRFDEPSRIDRVTLAVGVVDAVSGRLIQEGAGVHVAGLRDKAIINASGLFVFINLPDQPQYQVEVDARRRGFPFVEHFSFVPPSPGNGDPMARRHDVAMAPGPDYPFEPGTTLIRGVVTRGSVPVEGAAISAAPAPGGATYTTRSIASGAFALPLRLRAGSHEPEAAIQVSIEASQGGDARLFLRPIVLGRGHSFLEPLDLRGDNEPGFFVV